MRLTGNSNRGKSYFQKDTESASLGSVRIRCRVPTRPPFSASPSWGLLFESQSPTRRYYLTEYEPVISLPSSLRKGDLMWQIQGPRWQISQESAVISTTHFMVRLPPRQEMRGISVSLSFSPLLLIREWISIKAWPRKSHDRPGTWSDRSAERSPPWRL